MEEEIINAEVISVFPDKVKIAINDLENFQIAEDKLKVGSYIRIADNDDSLLIAIIENFSIEIKDDESLNISKRIYMIEAIPLGMLIDGKFERGGDTLTIPPKTVEPAKKEEIDRIYNSSIDDSKKFVFSKLSSNKDIMVPVDGNKFFGKHIAIVGSTGSGKSYTVAKIIQNAVNCKNSMYKGLNNSHIIIFDIHSEYRSAFKNANLINIDNLILPYWLLNGDELEELFLDTGDNKIFNKKIYSAVNDEFKTYIKENDINSIFLCGIDTDACVLKTAVDLFENNIDVKVIEHCCMSHSGKKYHNYAIKMLKKLIGKDNII